MIGAEAIAVEEIGGDGSGTTVYLPVSRISAEGVAVSPPLVDLRLAILWDDGSAMLWDDGTAILWG